MSDALRRALRGDSPGDHVDDATLASYLDGSLPAPERRAAEEHLGRCAQCAEELAAAARVELEAEALGAVERPAPRHLTSARRQVAGPRTRTWFRLAAAVVLGLGTLLLGRAAGRFAVARFEPALLSRLADWSGRSVSVEGAGLVLAGGPGLALYDVSIADDPRFSDASFVSARSVALRLQPQGLLEGRLGGRLELDRPSLRLIRDPAGNWNVETLGDGAARTSPRPALTRAEIDRALEEAAVAERLAPGASEEIEAGRFVLASARVEGGTLEIEDAGGRGRTLRVRDVDLTYEGRPGRRATLSLDGALGSERDRIALRGEIGPFTRDGIPVYRFPEVELVRVPVEEIPGAPAAVLGLLTFAGRLESAGRSWSDVVSAARGTGHLALCCGALEGRNVAREILRGLAALPGADGLLQAANARGALAASLDPAATPYEEISGAADLRPGTLHLRDTVLQTALFRARLDGSLGLQGSLAASGSLELAPELSAVLLAAAPGLAPLADAEGALRLPFRAEGSWPNVDLHLDAAQVLARLAPVVAPSGRVPGLLASWLFRSIG